MPSMEIHGANYHYEERGTGLAVVLVHGFPLDGRIWEDQVSALSERWRVIVPDLRGFGQSQPPSPFTIESLADDLHALLAGIGALPCVIGGLSMGGYVCFAFITKYATEVKGLVLVDTRCEADAPEGKEGRLKMIEACRAGGAKAVADQMEAKMLAPGEMQTRPHLARDVRAIMESQPGPTIEYACLALRDREDYRDKLASVAAPTLIVVGEADAITPPAVAQGMHREIPQSKLAIIPAAGHLSPMEQPHLVTSALRRFLEQVEGA